MAAKDVDSGVDMTTCCICIETYTNPKVLPCIHTFCMKCIQENGQKTNKRPGDEMPCPICRRMFTIPTEGFHALPNNFFIERLMQMANSSGQSASSRILCEACLEENEEELERQIPTADSYCVDCNQQFCKECCKQHKKLKLTRNHKLVNIDDHDSIQNLIAQRAQIVCELHEQRVMDVYCVGCKTVACPICFIEYHNDHKGSHVNKCVDDFRKKIERNVQMVKECRFEAETKQAEFLEMKENIQERVQKLVDDVANRKAELKQLIDMHETSLLQVLYSIRRSKLKEVEMEADDLDTYLLSLDTYNSYCQKVMAEGSASDICRAFSDLSDRATELHQQCRTVVDRNIQPFKLYFRKSEIVEFAKEDNLLGEIEDGGSRSKKRSTQSSCLLAEQSNETDRLRKEDIETKKKEKEAELRYKSDPVFVQTIRTNSNRKSMFSFGAPEESKGIRGLTIVGKELFVLSQMSTEVQVYDSVKFNLRRRWTLNQLHYPLDIGSCHTDCKCLYIFDFKGQDRTNEILRVDTHGNVIKKWSTGYDWGYSLSVTEESNVILTVCYKNKLNEYSPNGRLMREINLSPDAGFRHLGHAIKLTNGQFLVSHGFAYFDLHRVCLVDADGNLKKSFDGKPGSTIGQMNLPFHLSVDENGFVTVADLDNGRVFLLDPDLEFKREILSKDGRHGLRYPERILLDESSGRLFVADNDVKNQRILIFNIY